MCAAVYDADCPPQTMVNVQVLLAALAGLCLGFIVAGPTFYSSHGADSGLRSRTTLSGSTGIKQAPAATAAGAGPTLPAAAMSSPAPGTHHPIVFLQNTRIGKQGFASYLKYTISAACRLNPEKQLLFFLSEQSHKQVPSLTPCSNIQLVSIESELAALQNDARFQEFSSVYKPMIGRNHGQVPWVRFLFDRFFIMRNYLLRHPNITSYWTFDSDFLVMDSLQRHEHKYTDRLVDTTAQCNGKCVNGFVANAAHVLDLYTADMISLFKDAKLLNEIKATHEVHPEYALTEMYAFWRTRRVHPELNVLDLSRPIDGEMFDHAWAQVLGPENVPEYTWSKEGDHKLMRVNTTTRTVYVQWQPTGEWIRAIGINTSWRPGDFVKKLYEFIFEGKWA